jgi:thiol:disulfide interchange protein
LDFRVSAGTPSEWSESLKKNVVFLLGLVLVALAGYFGNLQVQSYFGKKARQETGLKTHSLPEAVSASAQTRKTILVEVSAVWCTTCRALDKKVLSDSDVRRRINNDSLFVRLDFESPEGEAFMKRYALTGFPQVVELNPNQSLIKTLPVVFEPKLFLERL